MKKSPQNTAQTNLDFKSSFKFKIKGEYSKKGKYKSVREYNGSVHEVCKSS
jgi:hypothetical protein